VVVSLDARREPDGTSRVFTHAGSRPTGLTAVDAARRAADAGAGEILLTSIDRDGTMTGYDLELVRSVAEAVSIPVIACGGAGDYAHLGEPIAAGASAVAAGSVFVYVGRKRGVMINYPDLDERP
jgi:imidazole glycerol-phosphate synthase subunit HisF